MVLVQSVHHNDYIYIYICKEMITTSLVNVHHKGTSIDGSYDHNV